MPETLQLCHGTCVARRGAAVLLRGAPGSGKSDLALRFVDWHPDAWLVADDQVTLRPSGGQLFVGAPDALKGLIEVRGLGLARRAVPAMAGRVPLRLIVDMVPAAQVPRIAEPRFDTLHGIHLPVIALAPFEHSAPQKLALALETIGIGGFPGDDGLLV